MSCNGSLHPSIENPNNAPITVAVAPTVLIQTTPPGDLKIIRINSKNFRDVMTDIFSSA